MKVDIHLSLNKLAQIEAEAQVLVYHRDELGKGHNFTYRLNEDVLVTHNIPNVASIQQHVLSVN